LAGLLRDKTPQKLDGTVGQDVVKMIRTFRYENLLLYVLNFATFAIIRSGMTVKVQKPVASLIVADEPDFGWTEAPLGPLNAENDQLKANLDLLLETLKENQPRREGTFITRVTLLLEEGHKYAK